MKLIVIAAALALLVWLLLGRSRRAEQGRARSRATGDPATAPETMVACAHCGVHLPRSEAISDGSNAYCSTVHRVAGPRPRDNP
jgi:uncharacterized protein